MKSTASFKKKLAEVMSLWEKEKFDQAFREVEELIQAWPGNAHLLALWAGLVQLQEEPEHSLDEVKKALHHAVDLDKQSPASVIELGHFLDNVDDDPQAALKAFVEGVSTARRLLIDGLLGQARALLQLDKRDEAMRCLTESLYLADVEASLGREGAFESKFAELMKDMVLNRSA